MALSKQDPTDNTAAGASPQPEVPLPGDSAELTPSPSPPALRLWAGRVATTSFPFAPQWMAQSLKGQEKEC